MTTLGDNYVLNESFDTKYRNEIIGRTILNIPDTNSGSYQGDITFDLTALGLSDQWVNYQEAYIVVPFVISAKSTVDVSAANVINPYILGLKNGYYQLVDSVSVEMGTKSVVQTQAWTNVHTNFKLLSSFSQDDLQRFGPTLGFYPDEAGSYKFEVDPKISGQGYMNNSELGEAVSFERPSTTNEGFDIRRRNTTAFDGSYGGLPTISVSESDTTARSIFKFSGAGDATRVYNWVVYCTIRLGDLTDLFKKIPLTKMTDCRIVIKYNACDFNLTMAAGPNMSMSAYTQRHGHTNPIMFGSGGTPGSAATAVVAIAGVLTISANVMSNGINTASPTLTSCRLYVPAYKLSPATSLRLLSAMSTTKFTYSDIYSYTFSVGANQTFQHTLATGITNGQYVVVVPFPKTNVRTVFSGTSALVQAWQSPFDSAPGTSSAIAIGQFQIQIAGNNIFNADQRYDFEQFMNELSRIYSLNGSLESGLNSGLLNEYMFKNAYRHYVADISRREPSEDLVPKSVIVMGTNLLEIDIELICFIGYSKSLEIDTKNGRVL